MTSQPLNGNKALYWKSDSRISFPGRILDAAGLASKDALKFHPLKIPQERERGDLGAIPPRYVE